MEITDDSTAESVSNILLRRPWLVRGPLRPKNYIPFAELIRVVGAIVAQLILLGQLRETKDITFDSWAYYISTQIVQSLGLITACVPYIKNVLLGINSGMFQTGDFHLATLRKDSVLNDESNTSTVRAGTGVATDISTLVTDNLDDKTAPGEVPVKSPHINPFQAQNIAVAEPVTPEEEWDGESQSSRANIIKQSRGWQVEFKNL